MHAAEKQHDCGTSAGNTLGAVSETREPGRDSPSILLVLVSELPPQYRLLIKENEQVNDNSEQYQVVCCLNAILNSTLKLQWPLFKAFVPLSGGRHQVI